MLLSMEEFRAFQPKKTTYALFGWPLGHTMSPELHAQLFEASGQDAEYIGVAVPPDDLAEAFRRVHLFLNPDGLFVFDINTPEKFARIDGESYVREDEGVFCVWQAAVEDGLCAYQFDIFEQDGECWSRAQETHEERVYTPEELTAMLEQAGFTEIKTYGNQSFAPVQGGEDRIYFTARKRD